MGERRRARSRSRRPRTRASCTGLVGRAARRDLRPGCGRTSSGVLTHGPASGSAASTRPRAGAGGGAVAGRVRGLSLRRLPARLGRRARADGSATPSASTHAEEVRIVGERHRRPPRARRPRDAESTPAARTCPAASSSTRPSRTRPRARSSSASSRPSTRGREVTGIAAPLRGRTRRRRLGRSRTRSSCSRCSTSTRAPAGSASSASAATRASRGT